NSGGTLASLGRHDEAADRYKSALSLDPGHPFTKGMFLHQKMLCCDWSGIQSLIAEIESDISLGKLSAHPFGWNGITHSQKSAQLFAKLYSNENYPEISRFSPKKPTVKHGKIRIGYVSEDFRDHCTSHLLVGLLEQH